MTGERYVEILRWPAHNPGFRLHNPGLWAEIRMRVDTEHQEYVVEGKEYSNVDRTGLAKDSEGTLAAPATPMPNDYLAGGGVSKLLRYYWCGRCLTLHWEDERAKYDEHITHQSPDGIQYGHRPHLGLVR